LPRSPPAKQTSNSNLNAVITATAHEAVDSHSSWFALSSFFSPFPISHGGAIPLQVNPSEKACSLAPEFPEGGLMKIRIRIKAGRLAVNHNQTVR